MSNNNKLSYEEQVLKIGNGKMLEPGFYDKDMNKIADIIEMPIIRQSKRDEVVVAIFEKDRTEIKANQCNFMLHLKSVVLPDNLKVIQREAFFLCQNLTEINLPDSLEVIEEYAFQRSGLTAITIPAAICHIRDGAFLECGDLESFVMKDNSLRNPVFLGSELVCGCYSLTKLVLSGHVTEIHQNAFLSCESLTDVVLPDSVERIEKDAFENCYNLNTVQIGTNIKYIDQHAFNIEQTFDIIVGNNKINSSDLRNLNMYDELQIIARERNKIQFTDEEIDLILSALADSPVDTSKELADRVWIKLRD